MIDTLMAVWNRGYGGRGILVSLAFLIICISISLLLVTVGNSWSALWSHGGPPRSQGNVLSPADMTATATTQIGPMASGPTTVVYAPTVTPTTNPCLLSPTVGKTARTALSPTTRSGSSGGYQSPTPTQRPRPTNTPTPRPRPTDTPTPRPTATDTPTPQPTATDTPTPTATDTPTPQPTPTDTPTPTPTATDTPTPTPTVGASPTPTASSTATSRSRGGTPVTGPSATATMGKSKASGNGSCQPMYSGNGDSVGMTFDGSVSMILLHDIWLILGGSTLGTMLFYVALYLLNRKRVSK